ncbi:MAG TPA: gamma-glutamyltransferase [Thermoanaerobaculaceae bacterium]|nr:gamma-glutamyltransferase [Thermoanaerobaculaceae bacterium]HPS78584.1 gamma-glutamyltransferase [Thermoanaerobaculaceae bacterium]
MAVLIVLGRRPGGAWQVPDSPGSSTPALPPELVASEERSSSGMVASADPQASRAGAVILERGGNAVDAAVATAFALGVVDPTCAGLGGQALALVHLADGREVAVDGSAPVPVNVVPRELLRLKDSERLFGYPVSATPSMLATMTHLLRRFGTVSLAQALQPAIELAERGHTLRPYVRADLEMEIAKVMEDDYLAGLFLRDRRGVWPDGCMLQQPVLAATMRRIAAGGEASFRQGRIAAEIEADMLAGGGYVRRGDLAAVKVVEREPVRGRYRAVEVVSFPDPGGGNVLVGALQILEAFPPDLLRQDSANRLHLLVEAVRIAMIDNALARHPQQPDPDYGRRRARLIRFDRALEDREILASRVRWVAAGGTTQISVMDRWGNAVAMTETLGTSGFVASPTLGFQYNSLLDSFDLANPASPRYPAPMRVARTSMAPTLLLQAGAPLVVLGGAGSSRIPSSMLLVISNLVDRGLSLGQAISSPRVVVDPPKGTRVLLELAGAITSAQADSLQARGFANQFRLTFPPRQVDLCAFGGVNAVMVEPGGMLVGVGDPRRQGGAAAPSPPAAVRASAH